uniref:Putative mitochondrial protein n=1 Tax=Tanacetum cinerariifolium TaxID=118510 RepID=A0A6L2K0Y5_TANCI|nr:putative mitochondrial protein [Tanacetum cinerariifolium]
MALVTLDLHGGNIKNGGDIILCVVLCEISPYLGGPARRRTCSHGGLHTLFSRLVIYVISLSVIRVGGTMAGKVGVMNYGTTVPSSLRIVVIAFYGSCCAKSARILAGQHVVMLAAMMGRIPFSLNGGDSILWAMLCEIGPYIDEAARRCACNHGGSHTLFSRHLLIASNGTTPLSDVRNFNDYTYGELVAWNVYEAAILQRFRAINEDPMAELMNLKYETTVKEYQKEEECLEEEEEEESDRIAYELSNQTPQSLPHISLNALSGIPTHNTMRVRGHVLRQLLHILIDSGNVFEVPTELPPRRSFDHRRLLKEENVTINIRPYRYPPSQKDTIEAIVKELLDSGVIRPSNIPFSSPIVMVKKKYGSWRMCIDYRHLNKHTVKDKFPIPVIEELIDELQGAQVFSKLDQRSGYHQIRMCESDVYKTAFKTHEGHYEFVVMPFGLTNAPSTFQALMNSVFKPFLRKFTLVFFDDILVYSPSIHEHIEHLRMVLQVMREHHLFAKQSKCVFGTTQVNYLGHVISTKGVSTDPSKIKDMQEWPVPTTLKQLRGFLGFTGYYRRFIKGYASISQPSTLLLKKKAFKWNLKA